MAKRMLFDILVKVLGEFVELNENVSILHGEVKTLEVTIPWTALLNSPVKLLIDGVNLQVGPLNVAALDKEETRKRIMDAKLQKLKMVDKFMDFSAAADNSTDDGKDSEKKQKVKKATYVQQWTAKIIDNIEITVRNVHIRYEDSQTIPMCIYSAGITLNSFTLSTCDDNWQERFIARDINNPSTSTIRKMAKVQNLGVYWMTRSQALSGLSFSEWSTAMQHMIYRNRAENDDDLTGSSSGGVGCRDYMLSPQNSLVVKLTHNERPLENEPKFDLSVDSTALPVSLDRAQYLQFLRTMQMIGSVEKKRQPYMYRPEERPVSSDAARSWWRYACKMIIKRKRYIELVKLSKTFNDETGKFDVRSDAEKQETYDLEERMPLRALVIFRFMAARDMQNDSNNLEDDEGDLVGGEDGDGEGVSNDLKGAIKRKPSSNRANDPGTGTWWGWWTGANNGSKSANTDKQHSTIGDTEKEVVTVAESGDKSGIEDVDDSNQSELSNSEGYKSGVSSSRSISERTVPSAPLGEDTEVGSMQGEGVSELLKDHRDAEPSSSPRATETAAVILHSTTVDSHKSSPRDGKDNEVLDKKNSGKKVRTRGGTGASDTTAFYNGGSLVGPNGPLDNDVSISSIISTLEKGTDTTPVEEEFMNVVLFRLNLTTSATLDVAVGTVPVASATMALKLIAEATVAGVVATIDMTDLLVMDRCTPDAAIREVIRVKDRGKEEVITPPSADAATTGETWVDVADPQSPRVNESKVVNAPKPEFTVKFESLNGKKVIRLSALPFELVVNKPCIQQLIGLLLAPPSPSPPSSFSKMKAQRVQSSSRRSSVSRSPSSFDGIKASRDHKETPEAASINACSAVGEFSLQPPSDSSHVGPTTQPDQIIESDPGKVDAHPLDHPTGWPGIDIIFEAHAPKIIVPESALSSCGFLLLDTGFLVVKGAMREEGMTWDVALRDVNAGMPKTTQDMYDFGQQQLYLIKPFDIAVMVQTTDQSKADMTVGVDISPEVRGELDSQKLSRLLQSLQVLQKTFSRANCLESVSHANDFAYPCGKGGKNGLNLNPISKADSAVSLASIAAAVQATFKRDIQQAQALAATTTLNAAGLPIDNLIDNRGKVAMERGRSVSAEREDIFLTPPQSPSGTHTFDEETSPYQRNDDEGHRNKDITETGAIGFALESVQPMQTDDPPINEVDPSHVGMDIRVSIPVVALDLAYNVEKGHHIILAVRTLEIKILLHPYDMEIFLDLSEISIQDSMRSEAQRDLARTPRGSQNLVHIYYASISDAMSPVYRNRASEVVVNFANLDLDFDVNTLAHLRPFLEVLLQKRIPATPLPPTPQQPVLPSVISTASLPRSNSGPLSTCSGPVSPHLSSASTSAASLLPPGTSGSTMSLKGMHIYITVENISLDLLRTADVGAEDTGDLASAFSLQIADLRADIDMYDLMRADCKLRSFDIIDARDISRDYVFRTVFCPVYDMDASLASWRAKAAKSTEKQDPNSPRSNGDMSTGNSPRAGGKQSTTFRKTAYYSIPAQKSRSIANSPLHPKEDNRKSGTPPDLLHVIYNQESRTHSFVNVMLMNTTSFVAIDTILDLANVATANAFAVLDLLAAPPPIIESTPPSPSTNPGTDAIPPTPVAGPQPRPSQRPPLASSNLAHQSSPSDEVMSNVRDGLCSSNSTPHAQRESLGTEELMFTPSVGPSPVAAAPSITKRRSSTSTSPAASPIDSPLRTLGKQVDGSEISRRGSQVISSSSGDLIVANAASVQSVIASRKGEDLLRKVLCGRIPGPGLAKSSPSGSSCGRSTSVEPPPFACNTINVSVQVTNPRLILLEDPTTDESRAIVSSCVIEVHYSRETKVFNIVETDPLTGITRTVYDASAPQANVGAITRIPNRELRESLHVSIHENRVSVLRSMLNWSPQPIMEPMGLEFNLRKRSSNGKTVETVMSLDTDTVNARVSINDIFLAQSILTRKNLPEPSPPVPSSLAMTKPSPSVRSLSPTLKLDPSTVATDTPSAPSFPSLAPAEKPESSGDDVAIQDTGEDATLAPSMSFAVNLGTLSLVGINDFNGQNIPVFRAILDGTTFYAEGGGEKGLQGDGSLVFNADFYNPHLSMWEPVLERWHPSLSVKKWSQGTLFEVNSEHTLQLTLSGIMLENLLKTYSLFLTVDDLADRETVPEVVINNTLGDGIDVEFYDTATGKRVLCVPGGTSAAMPRVADNFSGRNFGGLSVTHMPQAVDVWFLGKFGEERLPLYHVPFNINKPKAYNLQPRPPDKRAPQGTDSAIASTTTSHQKPFTTTVATAKATAGSTNQDALVRSRSVLLEPIIEETYENQRYDPITGSWRNPYFPGDPFEWTDASGSIRRDIQSIHPSSNQWEWLGKWSIDMDGVIGEEIDEDGWEYSTTFANFSIASSRRCSQSMDCVRRRRWIRTRVPSTGGADERYRPLTLFWEVQILQSGSRRVELRSGLQIRNLMPFALTIALKHTSWPEDVEFGPIEENDTFNVPLMNCCAVWLKLKPHNFPYDWSSYVPCNLQSNDFRTSRDVFCECDESSAVSAHVLCSQKEKSLMIIVEPYVVITNMLPYDIQYVCSTSDRKREEGSLLSGSSCKLAYINLASQPRISVRVGNFMWSAPRVVDIGSTDPVLLDIFDDSGILALVVSVAVEVAASGQVNLSVFSKGMVIDRTGGLNVSIWARRRVGTNIDIVRNTFGIESKESMPHPIVRPPLTAVEKKRRRATVRAAARLASQTAAGGKGGVHHTLRKNTSWATVEGTASASAIAGDAAGGGRPRVSSSVGVSTKSIESLPSEVLNSSSFETDGMPDDLAAILEAARNPNAPLAYGVLDVPDEDLNIPNEFDMDDDDDDDLSVDDSIEGVYLTDDESSSGQPHVHVPLTIEGFRKESRRHYEATKADVGELVYSDRNFRWTYLPVPLRKQIYIRTPCDDKALRSRHLIRFTVSKPALVLVLIDMRASVPPKWLAEDGFRRVTDEAIARVMSRNGLQELYFSIHGKYFVGGDEVVLRGNWSKTAYTMYTVFVLPAPARDHDEIDDVFHRVMSMQNLAEESAQRHTTEGAMLHAKRELWRLYDDVIYDYAYRRSDAGNSWIDGGNGLSLFYTDDDGICIGIKRGAAWCDDVISINMAKNSPNGFFEIIDWDNAKAYQLFYKISLMPGLFRRTQLVTVMPRYCIVNCLEEPILVVQRGSREILEVAPYHTEPWHKSNATLGTAVQLRCQSSLWSMGSVDLNEIGSSVIHLPRRYENSQGNALFLHVEVKLADPSEHCAVVAVIWMATVEMKCAFSIRNDSNVHITVKQAEIDFPDLGGDPDRGLFEVCVPPGMRSPFGWADPDAGSEVLVTVGTSMRGPRMRIAKLNLMHAGDQLRLPDNSGRAGPNAEVIVAVAAENGGRVLRISRFGDADINAGEAGKTEGCSAVAATVGGDDEALQAAFSFGLCLSLASFGISIVLERPVRREFMSLYIDGLEARLKTKGSMRSFEFLIMDLQVDNYSETAVYPVLLHSTKKEVHTVEFGESRSSSGKEYGERSVRDITRESSSASLASSAPESEIALFQMTLIEEMPVDGSGSVLKYVVVRLLPLTIEVDSATLQLVFSDLLNDLKFVDRAQALATSLPDRWIDEFNVRMLSPEERRQPVDVYRALTKARVSKMYIEKLVIHPMKFTLTFLQTPFPRKVKRDTSLQSTAINILTSLAGVDRMQIRLKSFEVEDALETRASLVGHVINRAFQDLQSQLAQIAGSLSVIGSPMGFARKVGTGVKSFFYEPYQGAVHSPHEFVVGLGRGTSALLANVVTGALNSTVALVGTASKGISFLSGDTDYIRKRAIKRQRNRADRGGIVQGLVNGGESLISGITSGVSGLVTKPLEEARKSGVKGFFRGIGLGLIGAAVKPVMGLTDGVTSVASGLSNAVDETAVHLHVRPARALERSAADASDLVITPLNLDSAYAQDFVLRRAKMNNYEDAYLSYIPMESQGESMILSETYVFWRKPKSLWGRTWANISHCFFMEDCIGVMLYGGDFDAVIIECGNRNCAIRVYTALSQNSHRMGNPASVLPVELVTQDNPLSNAARERLLSKNGKAASLTCELDGYRFGTANTTKLVRITGSERDVLLRAEAIIGHGYTSWKGLDENVWRLIWEWDCTHVGLNAARCCATIVINRSDSPIQISRVHMVHGRNVMLFGSAKTGYDVESRALMPEGAAVVFVWAFTPSPIEVGHLKAVITTVAFTATVASTQRESFCEAKGGFTVGFLEKSVTDWWSKYVLLIT